MKKMRTRHGRSFYRHGRLFWGLGLLAVSWSGAQEPLSSGAPGEKKPGVRAHAPTPVALKPRALDLRVGEELEYEISWNRLPAGRALLRVRSREPFHGAPGPEAWLVKLDTRSSRSLSLFYPVRDKARSWIDVQGGFSRFFYMEKREGAYRRIDRKHYWAKERIRFDYTLGAMQAICEQPRPDQQWRSYRIPLTGRVLDPLSAIFYLRATGLSLNRPIVLPICTDRRVWNTKITPIGRERLNVPGLGKAQPCLVVVPECEFSGLFVRRGEMKIWLHEKTKIPVKMIAQIPIGACEAKLIRYRRPDAGERK